VLINLKGALFQSLSKSFGQFHPNNKGGSQNPREVFFLGGPVFLGSGVIKIRGTLLGSLGHTLFLGKGEGL